MSILIYYIIVGLLPMIKHLKCGGEVLESLDSLNIPKDYMSGKCWIEASIDRMFS